MAASFEVAASAPLHANLWIVGLPEELQESILDHMLHMGEDSSLPAGLTEPLPQLYCTNRANRTAMLQWQRREEGAAGRARIGAANIKLAAGDKDGLGALEQLTRGFPRLATLRRLHLRFDGATPEQCLVSFLSQPGARENLATVLELTVKEGRPAGLEVGPPFSSEAFGAVCRACSSLSKLDLDLPIQGLRSLVPLTPLNQLSSLTELVLQAFVGGKDDGISPADIAALGTLTSLTKLSVFAEDLMNLLPGLSSLSRLSELCLESREGSMMPTIEYNPVLLDSPEGVPEFSALVSLQQLTHLSWAARDHCWLYRMYLCNLLDTTLSAICCCTQLVSLELPSHIDVRPHQLLLMPRLKSLVVGCLEVPEPLPLDQGCSLQTLRLLHFLDVDHADNADWLLKLLPLCRAVKQLDVPWLSKGPYFSLHAGTAEEVSASALETGNVARALQELSSLCGRAVTELKLICIEGPPRQPTGAIIAGLSPLQKQLLEITLRGWLLDQALVEQLAETLPGLQVLCLGACAVCLDALPGLLRLTQLSRLELYRTWAEEADEDGRLSASQEGGEALRAYAAAVQQDLTIVIGDIVWTHQQSWMDMVRAAQQARHAPVRRDLTGVIALTAPTGSFAADQQVAQERARQAVEDCQRAVQERRRAAGTSGYVSIVQRERGT